VREVILSGGDPLTLSDTRLASLVQSLVEIRHVTRLRVHTRLPIVLPERVTTELCHILTGTRLQCVVVVHANHPNEIDLQVAESLKCIRNAGATMFNQSVLLKGVNDNADVLCALSETLFAAGTVPYYLHLLDKVEGAAHFDIGEKIAQMLWEKMAEKLPGYLIPRLVREESGTLNKIFVR
jgi:KamA family protein